MTEVRRGVDALDAEIVRLIAQRFRYMDAAARIKPERAAVRDEARKAEVLRNVVGHARVRGAPEAAVAAGIRPQCPQEVDVPEIGPVRLAEVELRGRALPEAGRRRAAARPRCG